MHRQHDIGHLFGLDGADHIGDVGFERDRRTHEMRPITQSGQGHGVGAVPGADQGFGHMSPAPSTVPGTVHKDKVRHQITWPSFRALMWASE